MSEIPRGIIDRTLLLHRDKPYLRGLDAIFDATFKIAERIVEDGETRIEMEVMPDCVRLSVNDKPLQLENGHKVDRAVARGIINHYLSACEPGESAGIYKVLLDGKIVELFVSGRV